MRYIYLLAFIMLGFKLNATSLTNESFEYNGLCYRILNFNTNTVEIRNPITGGYYDGSSISKNKVVTVPQTVYFFDEEFTVVRIGDSAFSSQKNIRKYELPNTITSIGSYAFYNNESLENINIPQNVKSIESFAFSQCSSLKKINLPTGITYIGKEAFKKTGLTSIILPDSLTTIEKCSFESNRNLIEINIPDNVEVIEESAFNSCINVKTLNIGIGLKEIKQYAFSGCYNLSYINVADDNSSFYSENNILYSKDKKWIHLAAPNQIGNYIMPNTVKAIKQYAFNYSKLYSIKLSENLETIYHFGFHDCYNLLALILPSSLKSLMWYSLCPWNLKYLVIGDKMRTIDVQQFGNLENIICYNTNPPELSDKSFYESIYSTANLFVPEGAIEAYQSAPIWSKFKNIHGLSSDELEFIPIKSLTFEKDKITLKKGEIISIKYQLLPQNSTIPFLRWEVSNPDVAITAIDKLKGISEGTCTVTAYSIDGSGIKATFEVEVTNSSTVDNLYEDTSESIEYYNINGIKLQHPTNGINIVKYNDGTFKKVIVN